MDASCLSFENCFDVVFSNAVLHWVKNHKPVIEGLYKSLRIGGKILLRMGGKGDAEGMLSVIDDVKASDKWAQYFTEFEFPYTFLGIDEYQILLKESGFSIKRVELIPKDMTHDGKPGLEDGFEQHGCPIWSEFQKQRGKHLSKRSVQNIWKKCRWKQMVRLMWLW
jgi:trans-aconitate 2-methyltransferase